MAGRRDLKGVPRDVIAAADRIARENGMRNTGVTSGAIFSIVSPPAQSGLIFRDETGGNLSRVKKQLEAEGIKDITLVRRFFGSIHRSGDLFIPISARTQEGKNNRRVFKRLGGTNRQR